jgi:hypothetical protein
MGVRRTKAFCISCSSLFRCIFGITSLLVFNAFTTPRVTQVCPYGNSHLFAILRCMSFSDSTDSPVHCTLSELQRLLLSFRLVSVSFTSFPVCRFSRDVVAVSSRQHAFCSLTKGFSKVSYHENVYLCGEVEKTCSRWSRCQSIGLSYQCSVATFSASCQIVTPTISRVR